MSPSFVKARDLKPGDVVQPAPPGQPPEAPKEVRALEPAAPGCVHVRWTDESLTIVDENHHYPRVEK